jgi:hypothetical protein
MLKDKIGKNSIYFKKKPKRTRVNQETRDASFTRIILKIFWKTQSRIKTMLKDKIGKNSIYLKKKNLSELESTKKLVMQVIHVIEFNKFFLSQRLFFI